jgi:hypothetical protein
MKNIIIILLLLSSTQVVGQYSKEKPNYTVGIVGLSGLPISFIITEINYSNFVSKFGQGTPYMGDNKASAYNSMMNRNDSILITGALVTVAGLVIQHFITNKKNNKKTCLR